MAESVFAKRLVNLRVGKMLCGPKVLKKILISEL